MYILSIYPNKILFNIWYIISYYLSILSSLSSATTRNSVLLNKNYYV